MFVVDFQLRFSPSQKVARRFQPNWTNAQNLLFLLCWSIDHQSHIRVNPKMQSWAPTPPGCFGFFFQIMQFFLERKSRGVRCNFQKCLKSIPPKPHCGSAPDAFVLDNENELRVKRTFKLADEDESGVVLRLVAVLVRMVVRVRVVVVVRSCRRNKKGKAKQHFN